MGKSKKKKNLDFQKVKLKVGRKLQKADNITNASFRSRSIQIVQHIKADGGEPSTKRKLNINDLLSQCQHYNISTRHDAVIGLRELLSSNPQLLSSNLAAILERTSQLFTDKDAAVRMAIIRLLKTILPNISRIQLQPFFPVVSAYLCCAMTHIYEDVQADSLQVLDLFLDYMPVVVVQSSTQILPNFIEQISRQKNSGKADSARSLSVNPASKMASQKWRTKVLERLHKLLQCIVDCGIKEDNSSQNDDSVVHCVSGKETLHQPFSKTLHNGWQNPGYALKSANVSIIGSDDVKSSGINDEHGMRQFVKTMVPVLMECWMEATVTQTFSAADGSLLTEEAMSLRSNVTKVIQLLWRFISTQHKNQLEWLRSCHFTEFQNYLLQNFPYALHQGTKKKEKVLSEKSAVTLNLGICDIMTYFLPNSSANQTCDNMSDCLETICTYLSGILIGEETMDSHSTKICIQILTRIVDTGIHHEYTNILFDAGVKRYLVCHPLSSEKREFLKFFASVIVTSNTFISMEVQEQFFQSLPELFSLVAKDNHQMAELILCTMKKSACSNCLISLGEFVTEVLGRILTTSVHLLHYSNQQMHQIIDTIFSFSDVNLKGADTDTLVTLGVPNHRLFAELLYSLPVIEEDIIRGLSHLCRDDKLPVESCTYIIKCLNYSIDTRCLSLLIVTSHHSIDTRCLSLLIVTSHHSIDTRCLSLLIVTSHHSIDTHCLSLLIVTSHHSIDTHCLSLLIVTSHHSIDTHCLSLLIVTSHHSIDTRCLSLLIVTSHHSIDTHCLSLLIVTSHHSIDTHCLSLLIVTSHHSIDTHCLSLLIVTSHHSIDTHCLSLLIVTSHHSIDTHCLSLLIVTSHHSIDTHCLSLLIVTSHHSIDTHCLSLLIVTSHHSIDTHCLSLLIVTSHHSIDTHCLSLLIVTSHHSIDTHCLSLLIVTSHHSIDTHCLSLLIVTSHHSIDTHCLSLLIVTSHHSIDTHCLSLLIVTSHHSIDTHCLSLLIVTSHHSIDTHCLSLLIVTSHHSIDTHCLSLLIVTSHHSIDTHCLSLLIVTSHHSIDTRCLSLLIVTSHHSIDTHCLSLLIVTSHHSIDTHCLSLLIVTSHHSIDTHCLSLLIVTSHHSIDTHCLSLLIVTSHHSIDTRCLSLLIVTSHHSIDTHCLSLLIVTSHHSIDTHCLSLLIVTSHHSIDTHCLSLLIVTSHHSIDTHCLSLLIVTSHHSIDTHCLSLLIVTSHHSIDTHCLSLLIVTSHHSIDTHCLSLLIVTSHHSIDTHCLSLLIVTSHHSIDTHCLSLLIVTSHHSIDTHCLSLLIVTSHHSIDTHCLSLLIVTSHHSIDTHCLSLLIVTSHHSIDTHCLSLLIVTKYPSDQSMEEGTVAERFSPSQVDINMDADAVNRALGVCETVGSILKDLREKQCVVSIVASSLLQYIKNRKRFPVTVMTAVIYIANHLQFYNYKECKPFMPFLVDMIWGFLLAVGEFKCTNQNFCDIYIQDVRDLCSVFIASEAEMVEELCRDLTISLKGASNLDDVHVICESMNYILHGVKLRDSIKTLDRSHLQTDLDIVKPGSPVKREGFPAKMINCSYTF
ncbi:hypothetical protein FSP39_015844 [Pinctada imbricata]|uniref:Pre-rRNA-processing protein Ipi1 N-terminal domain-containing protein n=1 Tax=Pinctada imbricata TaxID=66713 RepID=A0AA89CBW9_PINIB|nr:hypothetical protein FSP39_015844 [Pinctada imbricata]